MPTPPPPPRLHPRSQEEEGLSISPRALTRIMFALAAELVLATLVILVLLVIGKARADVATLVSVGVLLPLAAGAVGLAMRARRAEAGR